MAPALILLLAHLALMQQHEAPSPTFRAGVSLVKVDAQVVDRQGRVVSGLTAADFQILDDGTPQKIAYFNQEGAPLDLVLLLDVSGSMHRHLQQIAGTARAALQQLHPGDCVGVMPFARRTEVRQPLTPDLRAAEEGIRDAVDAGSLGSGTAINAAIIEAARYLERQPVRGRRAVLIVTDNLSLNYQAPDDEVLRRLYAADAVLDSIVIGKLKRPEPAKPGQYANPDFTPSDVFKLALESGGEAIEAGKIGETFERMIERIRARYSMQYDAPPSAPGAFHRISVALTPEAVSRHRNPLVRARAGYYAAP